MQLSPARFETKPFRLTVTDYEQHSLAEARPKVDAVAKIAGVTVDSYQVEPMVLESMPTQSIVKGTFSGSSDAVAAALELIEALDAEI